MNEEDVARKKVLAALEGLPHHELKSLTRKERHIIAYIYFSRWRPFVKAAKLRKTEGAVCKAIFQELHAQYYKKVEMGARYVTADRLIKNFLISRTQENLRAILQSFNPYNGSSFVSALRSQMEINALLNKFISDDVYHREHLHYNQDRDKVKTEKSIININTLIAKIGKTTIDYESEYKSLSLLLHPNPAAYGLYAQIDISSVGARPAPIIKEYFSETISPTKKTNEWFNSHTWLMLLCICHFLKMLGDLTQDFFINESEEVEHQGFLLADFVRQNQREILSAANAAAKSGDNLSDAVGATIKKIMEHKR